MFLKFLTALGVLFVVISLIFVGSFFSFKYYLEKNTGVDIYHMFEFQADELLSKSSFPTIGLWYKNLVKPLYPKIYGWEMFAAPVSIEESYSVYDITEKPAVLSLVGVSEDTPDAFSFRILMPTALIGEIMDSKVSCQVSKTTIADYRDSTKTARIELDIDKGSKVDTSIVNIEPYNLGISVAEYLKQLTESVEFQESTISLRVDAKCADSECNSIGPECKLTISKGSL